MKERILNIIGLSLLAICFVVSLGRIAWPKSQTTDGRNVETIRIAHWQLEGGVREALDRLGKEYEAMHPNVRIQQIPIPEKIYTNWLITQLVGGTAPDIIQIGIGISDERLARFFDPITTLVESPNPYNKGTALEKVPMQETFFDGMLGGYNENLLEYYGVPLSGTSIRMYYNLDLLRKITGSEQLPTTFREFIALCRQAVDFGKSTGRALVPIAGSRYNGPQLMNLLFESQTQLLMEELSPAGGLMRDPISTLEWYADGKWSPESPAILSGMRLMREVAQFMQPGFMQLQRDDATFYFVQGRALMICSGSWDATSIRSQAPFRVGVSPIPFPTTDDPDFGMHTKGRVSEAGSLAAVSLGLTRASKHPEIAKDFLRFLGSQPANKIWTDVSRWVPSVIGVPTHVDVEPFLPMTKGATPGFALATQPDAMRVYGTSINDLFGQEGSPEKFAQSLSKNLLEAQASDLRRSLLSTHMNSKRRDTVLASLAVQSAKAPTDSKLAEKFDKALQAESLAERGNYMAEAALRANESAQNKKP